MKKVDVLRNNLIDKLLSITDPEYLSALLLLIEKSNKENEQIQLSEEQIEMLKMSENDILNGHLVSQKQVDKEDLEWLKGL